ncbi:MAG: Cell division protein FtsB [Sporanaerobacter sp.]|jgi:cell division protein DivIC|uniref:FtsB family cell division protein n=1 Tax=Sporanaerobacter sp. TaxID=2010183 RepID=UPI003A0FBC4F
MAKRKKKNVKKFRIRHLIVLVFAIYISATLISQRRMLKSLNREKAEMESEVKTLNTEINEINKEIKNSDSLEFVEKVAREELKMVKPREIIYIDKSKNKDPFLKKSRK